jgi:hypothetical protein
MIPGRTLAAGEAVFTDWFSRGGDNIIMRAQVIDRSGTTLALDVNLYTKNAEDTGDGTGIEVQGSSSLIALGLGTTSTAVQTLVFQSPASSTGANKGMLEMVRYRLVVQNGTSNDGHWLTVRLFPPIFFDKGKP